MPTVPGLPPRATRQRSPRYRWLAQVLMGLFVVTMLGVALQSILRDHDLQLSRQLERAKGNALVFEDDATQAFQLVENTLRALPEVVDEPLIGVPPGTLSDVLRRLRYSQPAIRSLSMLDARGTVLASSQAANVGQVVNLHDFMPGDSGSGESSGLRVGPVWEGRDLAAARPTTPEHPADAGQPYFVPLLQRLGEGSQAVWLLATLNPEHLLGRMDRFLNLDSDRVDIVRFDGRGLITTADESPGVNFPFAALLARIQREELGVDDRGDQIAFRASVKYPVFVSVRISRDVVLTEWRRRSLAVGVGLLVGVAALLTGFVWLMRRLREGEQAEAWQQDTIVRLFQALEQSPSGILIFSERGRIEYCNRFFAELTGHAPGDVLGHHPPRFDAGEQAEARFQEVLALLVAGQIWRGEVLRRRADGSTYPAQVVAAPLRDVDGHITHCVSVEHDLTEAKRTLAELGLARDRAEAATRSKSAFLANMSHEIRTPMNGVIGIASLLLDSTLSPEQREQTDTLRESAESLLHLIDDILDFSKAEAGKLVLRPVPFDPVRLLRNCRHRLLVTAQAKGLALTLELDEALPHGVLGDSQRLQQVLINLIGNAIKFTSRGGVTLRLRRARGLPGLHFEVQDSGIGIDGAAQSLLFQPFSQVDSSTTRVFGGTGLGLSICRQLVEAMGGRIGVYSRQGEGATFWFELPLPEVELPPPPKPKASSTSPAQLPALAGQVLLVEDQPVNQKLAMTMLRRIGLQAQWAANGREALEQLRARSFDLVLMDCQMPEMDGYEATQRIRAGDAGPAARAVPVLALTANVMPEDVARCEAHGFSGHIPKPFTLSVLHQALAAYLPAAEGVPASADPVAPD